MRRILSSGAVSRLLTACIVRLRASGDSMHLDPLDRRRLGLPNNLSISANARGAVEFVAAVCDFEIYIVQLFRSSAKTLMECFQEMNVVERLRRWLGVVSRACNSCWH